jgi:hypothetical protein
MTAIRSFFNSLSLPGGSSQTVILLIAAVIIVLVIVAIVYLISMATPQGRMDAMLDEKASRVRRKPASRWILRFVGILLVVGAVFAVSTLAGSSSQCESCHKDSPQIAALPESAHAQVECMSCHRKTGINGTLRTAGTYVRWVYTYAATQEDPVPESGSVEDAACLSCHGYIRTETTERRGIKVRHSDFLDLGARCRDCHNSTAHPDAVQQPSEPEMSDCIVCHNDEIASAECSVCHVDDPLLYTASAEQLPKTTEIDTSNCYGCHIEYDDCLWCHGQTMPHPEGWGPAGPGAAPGGHVMPGFTERETCYRCHYGSAGMFNWSRDACEPCHDAPRIMHGGPAWVQEHGLQATGVKGGELSDCFTCHRGTLCDDCHPPSYRERYNPRGGADQYPRTNPVPDYEDY